MRKVIYMLFATCGLMLVGCGGSKDNETPSMLKKIAGEWHLTKWNGETPSDFDTYISFTAEKTFLVYQKIEQLYYQEYTGTFQLKGNTLKGIYTDKTNWGGNYTVSIDTSGTQLTMTSSATPAEVGVYTRTSIPDAVKTGATLVARTPRTTRLPL